MAAFFSGLMGSYSDAMRGKHKQEREKEDKRVDAELEVLKTAVRDPSMTQEAREAAFERMEELTGQGKGKKKGGFSFKNLIGKFGDVGGPQGKTLSQRVAGQQGGQGGGQGGTSPTPAGQQQPAPQPTQPAGPAAAPAVPSRPQLFKTQQQMTQE